MAFPTAVQLKNTFLLEYESRINQTSPLNNKAFLRITSAIMAIVAVLLQKEVISASRENLAITASRAGLILIGNEYNLPIKEEISAVLNITLPAVTGTQIPSGTNFVGDDNGILYFNPSVVTAAAGFASIQVTSREPGVIGNLVAAQTLSISRQISGAELVATVVTVETTGADEEETEVYRQRVLDIIRAPGGGGNAADFRNWAQEQEGVARAFPYAGVDVAEAGFPGEPPQRTVYIEADSTIDPDGIAPGSLITDTKNTIITDPVTGLHRQPLGLTNDTLFVRSITRTDVFVKITSAVFDTGTEAQVKSEIDIAVTNYMLSLQPFIQGIDIDSDRNDLITDLTVAKIVQDVLESNSASAEEIDFGIVPAVFIDTYLLSQGEKAKNGGVTYA